MCSSLSYDKFPKKYKKKYFSMYFCESTALEHKFKRWFCTQKPVLNVRFKDFLYARINPTQIWYDKKKKSLHTQHEFLTFNNQLLHLPHQI